MQIRGEDWSLRGQAPRRRVAGGRFDPLQAKSLQFRARKTRPFTGKLPRADLQGGVVPPRAKSLQFRGALGGLEHSRGEDSRAATTRAFAGKILAVSRGGPEPSQPQIRGEDSFCGQNPCSFAGRTGAFAGKLLAVSRGINPPKQKP